MLPKRQTEGYRDAAIICADNDAIRLLVNGTCEPPVRKHVVSPLMILRIPAMISLSLATAGLGVYLKWYETKGTPSTCRAPRESVMAKRCKHGSLMTPQASAERWIYRWIEVRPMAENA